MRRLFTAFALCVGCFTSSSWAEELAFEFDEQMFDEIEIEGPKPDPSFLDDLLPETQDSIRRMQWPVDKEAFTFCIAGD